MAIHIEAARPRAPTEVLLSGTVFSFPKEGEMTKAGFVDRFSSEAKGLSEAIDFNNLFNNRCGVINALAQRDITRGDFIKEKMPPRHKSFKPNIRNYLVSMGGISELISRNSSTYYLQ